MKMNPHNKTVFEDETLGELGALAYSGREPAPWQDTIARALIELGRAVETINKSQRT